MIIDPIQVIIVIGMSMVLVSLLVSLKIAPWLPSRTRDLDRIVKNIGLKADEKFVDLGAGDAKLLAALYEKSRSPHIAGVEIFLIPFFLGKIRLAWRKLGGKIDYRWSNFLNYPIAQADAIYCFLTPMALAKLRPWLEKNMKPESRLVSYCFEVPGWTPESVDRPSKSQLPVYRYRR